MSVNRLARDLEKVVDTATQNPSREAITLAVYRGIDLALAASYDLNLTTVSREVIADFRRDIEREGRFAALQARSK